jgi:hypothetical protein
MLTIAHIFYEMLHRQKIQFALVFTVINKQAGGTGSMNMKQTKPSDTMKRITALEMINTFGEMIKDAEVQHFYESLDGLADTQKAGLTKAHLAVKAMQLGETKDQANELLQALELLRDARKGNPRRYRPQPNLLPTH